MVTKSISTQFVAFLIEEYKALPSLWDVDNEAYKDKHLKRSHYNLLLNTMTAIDPLLTMDELKKKIAKIRTCYRRELKKVSESIKSGATKDEVYVPTLWYFDQMEFLRNQDQEPKAPEPDKSTTNIEIDDANADTDADADMVEWKPSLRDFKIKLRSSKHLKKSFVKKNTFLNKPIKHQEFKQTKNQTDKDEAALFSETWAILFRKLSDEQQLFGKRCIDEILYQGQLGNLNSSTYRNIETSVRGSPDSSCSTPHNRHLTKPNVKSSNSKNNGVNETTSSFVES